MESMAPNKKKIMIIGIGNHARRIYVPILKKYEKILDFELAAGVELIDCKNSLEEYLKEKGFVLPITYISKFDENAGKLPKQVENALNRIVRQLNVQGVVISTEPLVHKVYAQWALGQGLNILMDKPVSTRVNVTSDINQAKALNQDYDDLLSEYLKLQKKKQTIFSINTQRRYEPGFQKVFSLISETKDKFNIPVTSIQSQHSDGVWIFPNEIIDQTCHPYCQGYGKCSHSGYHIFDAVWELYSRGMVASKKPDTAEVYSSFVQPQGLLTQFNQDDYSNLFGQEYCQVKKWEDDRLYKRYENFGENDSFSLVRLLKDKKNICNISINLLHNSFSRRSSVKPGKDLYKGNGRVKAQYFNIQQGPFQCIQIHNYQANDNHDQSTANDYEIGGNNHFDIYVFRNAKMYGNSEKALQVFSVKDLDKNNELDYTKLFYETVKEKVIVEFINFILGNISQQDVKSNITTHRMPVRIMSAVYQSHIRYINNKKPISRFKIN